MNTPKKIKSVESWYHSIDLRGHITPGEISPQQHKRIADQIPDLSGKSVLDIGAADGYYSFLAEQRGAKRVVAIDSFPYRKGTYDQCLKGFKVAKEILGSKVAYWILGVEDLDELEEDFDVVFMFGVHYHLYDPILGFDKACAKCKELFLLEGDALLTPWAHMVYDFNPEDKSRTWRLSYLLLGILLKQRGFPNVYCCYFDPTATVGWPAGERGAPAYLTPAGRVFLRCWR